MALLKSKPISILLSVLILAMVGLSLISVTVAASGVGTWTSTTPYLGGGIDVQSCVVWGAYIYCVGGYNGATSSAVYYAKLTAAGIPASGDGSWMPTTSYLGGTITYLSCVVDVGYIYCIGGSPDGQSSVTNAVYFAKLSSSGVGAWKPTKSYPTKINAQSCIVSAGYVYCIGGGPTFDGITSAVYFAQLSSTGVGAWKKTTKYPTNIEVQSCVVNVGYVYCVGGYNGAWTSAVYYAELSSTGVGAWKKTTSYPLAVGYESCVMSGVGSGYCVGGYNGVWTGSVYYAKMTATGIPASGPGSWTATTSYLGGTIASQSCVVTRVHVYCVGGYTGSTYTNGVYYAKLYS